MKKQTTSVTHSDKEFVLNVGWLNYLYSEPVKAHFEIETDDIQLPNGLTAGTYKALRKDEFDALPDKSGLNPKKHLNRCSLHDFGQEWDELLSGAKLAINSACAPLLLKRHALTAAEQDLILRAASNGHVCAMYWIGTALRDIGDNNCLLWLSMAHNRGHVWACYEMAAHLKSKGNRIESLRCLIVSADGGCDHAFMSIFDSEVLLDMAKIEQVDLLENMLDSFSDTHSSSARYLKGMLMFFLGKTTEGIAALKSFSKSPKKQLPKKIESDDEAIKIHQNQIKLIGDFVQSFLLEIASGKLPLDAVRDKGARAGFLNFKDYDQAVTAFKDMRLSG